MLQLILLCVCIILSCSCLAAFSLLIRKLETIGLSYQQILKYLKESAAVADTQTKIIENYRDTALKIYQVYELTNAQYEEVTDRVDKSIALVAKIVDEYRNLGKAFKMCEDRYSDYYEQARETKELILKLQTAIEKNRMPRYWCGPGDTEDDEEPTVPLLIEKGA